MIEVLYKQDAFAKPFLGHHVKHRNEVFTEDCLFIICNS